MEDRKSLTGHSTLLVIKIFSFKKMSNQNFNQGVMALLWCWLTISWDDLTAWLCSKTSPSYLMNNYLPIVHRLQGEHRTMWGVHMDLNRRSQCDRPSPPPPSETGVQASVRTGPCDLNTCSRLKIPSKLLCKCCQPCNSSNEQQP